MCRFLRKYSNGNNPTNPGIPPSRNKAARNAGGVLLYYQYESQMQAAQGAHTDKAENRTGEQDSCTPLLVLLLSISGPWFPLLVKYEKARVLLILKFHAHAQYTANLRIHGLNIYECPDIN